MTTTSLGQSLLIADMSGDRPATVTKVYSANCVEACAFMPLPAHLKLVMIHDSRPAAINASQKDTGFHAYRPGVA